jgi:serine/threonine protein kinase
MADRVGRQLGNYRLIRLLGQGGFAEVYLGEHIYLGTQAAIKVLIARLAHEEIDEFHNEARTIARLRHPHIVRVLDFDVDGGIPFLVMDYAPHGTLRQRYPKGSCLAPVDILLYSKQVAAALQYAHDQKLIHRDVKPENMLLESSNDILLSDFGIAVVAHSSGSLDGQNSAGTLPYMAPEQLQGKPVYASDQYSLGIVVYEWLCGMRPFEGSYWEIISQHLSTPPPPLREKVPSISSAVEEVVMRALAKDPHQRFPSVSEFAEALAAAMEQASHSSTAAVGVRPAAPRVAPTTKATPQDATPAGQNTKQRWLDAGNAHYNAGEYAEAIAAYARALALDGTDAETYNYRGSTYFALKEYDKAIADFGRALTLDPSYTLASRNRGLAYSALKEQ